MIPRLKEIFNKEIQPALKSQFGFKNVYMGPRIEKVVLNMGLGLDATDSKILKFLSLYHLNQVPYLRQLFRFLAPYKYF